MRRLPRLAVGVAALSLVLVMLPAVAGHAVRVPETLSHRGPVTAGPVVPGFPIDHVGVLWNDPAPSEHASEHADEHTGEHEEHGAVRFRHDGTWGEWIPLIRDGAPGEGLWASGLVAGGGAEAFQVRGIPVGAGAPRTVALNTTDGPLRTTGLRFGGAAAIDSGSCLSRAEWGADESLRDREAAQFSAAQVMTLHHTATSNNDSNPAGTVRAIYEYHTVDNGWRDIGYNYLVDEQGLVYEGRWSGSLDGGTATDGWQSDTYSDGCNEGGTGADFAHESTADDALVAQGAHAGGYNTGNLGIALLGSFSNRGRYKGEPKEEAVRAAEALLAEIAARHGIDPQGTVDYSNDVNTKSVDAISAHRDFNATECPGDNLYALLPDIRANVAALVGSDDSGGSGGSDTDTAPTVTIASPSDGATFDSGTSVSFSGSASDTEDGDLTSDVIWTSNLDGQIGTGNSFSAVLSDGSHTITAEVTDSGGNAASDTVTVTVEEATTTGISLSVTAYKVRGQQTADLTWSGATSDNVVVIRDGAPIATTPNDGAYTDSIDQRGGGSYSYQVCEAGTSTCSDPVVATF